MLINMVYNINLGINMKRNVYRQCIGIVIFVLFFFLSISPTMSTNYKNEIKDVNFSEDDYINVYYKFDTGSGNIAYDSSDHEYDGTIYGATWVPHGSGYSLYFDGFNDYIDFDDYEHMGFNKTDDMIFSFYMKTTSTQKGTIFSCSNIYGVYPDIDIWLNTSGAIAFHYHVQYCGVTVTTDGTYNDGEWHFVKIYYNGITSNPTVQIYVDDELDAELTQWICHSSYDFSKIKMGRNSNDSTVFYEGELDEFKIVKYPGGNQQAIPIIDGPSDGNANEEYEFSFIINDPEEDDVWLYVDWGDGIDTGWLGPYTTGEEIILYHTWSTGGLYYIKARSMDLWDDGPPATHEMRIGDQPPDPPIISGPQDGEIDEVLDYTFVTNDYEGSDIELYVDWGDGQVEEWLGPYSSGEMVVLSHSWDEKDIYEIKAKAKDSIGEGDWSDPYEVIIGNDPPEVTITGPSSGKVGEETTFIFSITDIDGDNVWLWVSWGDGVVVEDFGPYESPAEIELSHTYTKKDEFLINAWARDELGAVGPNATLRITIPKNKIIIFNYFNWFFEKFPHAFPLLKYIMG